MKAAVHLFSAPGAIQYPARQGRRHQRWDLGNDYSSDHEREASAVPSF